MKHFSILLVLGGICLGKAQVQASNSKVFQQNENKEIIAVGGNMEIKPDGAKLLTSSPQNREIEYWVDGKLSNKKALDNLPKDSIQSIHIYKNPPKYEIHIKKIGR